MSENMSEKLVPEVRFNGFDDGWKYFELGDLTNFVTGKSCASDIVSDGSYIVM